MTQWTLESLIPHSGAMQLIDAVNERTTDWLTAEVTPDGQGLFSDGQTVPSLVGIEYMAQAVAAFAGYRNREANEPVRPGLLLGSRRFDCNVGAFAVGQRLRIRVEEVYLEPDGIGVFACQLIGDGVRADAHLTVFHPEDMKSLMND